MKAEQIFQARPGSVILLYGEKDSPAELAKRVCASMPEAFRGWAALNAGAVVSMELIGDDSPNSFRDLGALCARLITAAGRRSHFEGLLLLDTASLIQSRDADRLRALGEILAMPDGLASRCVTALTGPAKEDEVLFAADCLDFDGRLRVARLEPDEDQLQLAAVLNKARVGCASAEAAQMLQDALDSMRGEARFDPLNFIRSCAASQRVITVEMIRAVLDDPFSYLNRLSRQKAPQGRAQNPAARRIGFQNND